MHHFIAIGKLKLELPNLGQNRHFFSRVTLKFAGWLWKTIGHSSKLHLALCIISKPSVNQNLSCSLETLNSGQNQRFFVLCDLEIWKLTLKNNRAPFLSNIKHFASFHHHKWIQTGVTVRKQISWVVTSVTLTFDLWPWPFAWTSLLSLVITHENFMMIRWGKGVTDRRTDGRTDRRTEPFIELLGRSWKWPQDDQNAKISDWIFNVLQGPVSWIGHTRWIISVKLKLFRQGVIPVESHMVTDGRHALYHNTTDFRGAYKKNWREGLPLPNP